MVNRLYSMVVVNVVHLFNHHLFNSLLEEFILKLHLLHPLFFINLNVDMLQKTCFFASKNISVD